MIDTLSPPAQIQRREYLNGGRLVLHKTDGSQTTNQIDRAALVRNVLAPRHAAMKSLIDTAQLLGADVTNDAEVAVVLSRLCVYVAQLPDAEREAIVNPPETTP